MRFFFDNCIAPRISTSIAALDHDHDVVHLSERFARNTPDAFRISTLGNEGDWVIVSGDLRISRSKAEREAWIESSLTVFFLASGWGQLKLWEIAWRLVKWWPLIVSQAHTVKPGAGFVIPVSGNRFQQLR